MLLDDVADMISSGGYGTLAVNLFKGELPVGPDDAVALFSYAGQEADRAMAAGPGTALTERPRFQVQARGGRPDDAEKLARDIKRSLDESYGRLKNGVRYLYIAALQEPFFLHRDGTGRYLFACNYQVVRQPASSS